MFENKIQKDHRKRPGIRFIIIGVPIYFLAMTIWIILDPDFSTIILHILTFIIFGFIWKIIFFQSKYNKIIKLMSEDEKIKLEQSYLENKGKFKNIKFLDKYLLIAEKYGTIRLIKYSDIVLVDEGLKGTIAGTIKNRKKSPISVGRGDAYPVQVLIKTKNNGGCFFTLRGEECETFDDLRIYLMKYAPHAEIR